MATAKTTKVGGTSSCSKEPDMLSLPPMEGMPIPSGQESAQQGGGRLAPTLGYVAQPLKVFLESKAGGQGIGTHSSQLGEGSTTA